MIVDSAERDIGMRGVGAKGHDTEQPPLRTPADLRPLIVDLEMRILVLRDAKRSLHARQRSTVKCPLRFERRAPGGAPGQRDRQSLAKAQRVDRARARAIRPPIPIVVGQNRQEHQPAGEAWKGPGACRPVECRASRARADERDLIHLQRAVAFPHLDLVEAPALPQPMLDRDQRIGRRACRPARRPRAV